MSSSWQSSLRGTSPHHRRSRSRSKSPGSRLYEPTQSSRAKWNQPIISEYGDDNGLRPGSVSPSRQRPGSRTSSVGSRTGRRSNSRDIKDRDSNKGIKPIAINYTSYDDFSARRKSDRMSPEKTIRASSPVKSTGISPKHSRTSASSARPSLTSFPKKLSDSSENFPVYNNNDKTTWSKKLSESGISNSYSSRKLSETAKSSFYSSKKLSETGNSNSFSSRKLSDSDRKLSTISTGSTNGVGGPSSSGMGGPSSSSSSATQATKSQSANKFSLSALKMPIIETWDDLSKTTSSTSNYKMSSSSTTTSTSSYMSSKRKATSSTYIG